MTHANAWMESVEWIKIEENQIETLANTFAENEIKIFDHKKTYEVAEWKRDEKYVWIRGEEEFPLHGELVVTFNQTELPVYFGAVVRSEEFEKHFYAIDERLGVWTKGNETHFSIWAPTARQVVLIVGDTDYALDKKKNGTWWVNVPYNCHGKPYHYEITRNGETVEVIDPYTPSLTANSKRGVVIDFAQTKAPCDKKRAEAAVNSRENTVIYELHVRDATSNADSGVFRNRGKFLGLTDTNAKTPNGYTSGLSYFAELGVTHVQLLPINDFGRVDELDHESNYNWGYDPLFFQSPEGSYTTDPTDPISRVTECQEMIDTFHREGLSVIVDVVFNHVYIWQTSSFEKTVPGYYFRYGPNGELSNGTGCGNDIASERPMVRKFILDTVDHWLRHYKVDGFRFDLMGILDIETMQQIKKRSDEENLPMILLGEGWDMPTALDSKQQATSFHAQKLPGIAFFNDLFRDATKGSTFEEAARGYFNGEGAGKETIYHLFTGSIQPTPGILHFNDPLQSVNYIECHDNLTLWDKLERSNPEEGTEEKRRIHQLATSFTILSQGIPFLHAGQEMYRTKNGDANSYISGDAVNALDWKQREHYDQDICLVRDLLKLRDNYPLFRMSSREDIESRIHELSLPDPVFGVVLVGENEDITCLWNPGFQPVEVELSRFGRWKVQASNDDNIPDEIQGDLTSVPPLTYIVCIKDRKV
ncbi:type I pullulanase [Texcoconibacillus texcoconensis]|uniref:Pullulanase n=1 Tax=Texcoconibacillus texcoconensis TaxID=1095777 RepID=A0A840QTW9_9BACI|nr:type I pullulanase [Texcoconibacillus texcoconensis]MBB5174731.1 pullulanase [Texcoconibacillus texcoconensis]